MPSSPVGLVALAKAAHPFPSLAVTAAATLLATGAGNSASTCVLVAAAVLAGQLSVGWSNDRIDLDRDRRVGHPGKPVAAGEVSLWSVNVAIVLAVVATVVLSLLLGWRAGGAYLVAVAAAWAYNAWLKRTWLSWLPYTVGFALLPAVATFALPDRPAPAGWVVAAAGLVGTAVNFVNALPHLADHPLSDVHGAPDRLGAHVSLLIGAGLILASSVVVAVLPPRAPDALSWAQLAVTVIGSGVGVVYFWPRAAGRAPFYGLMAIAPVQLITAVIIGHPLH